MHSAAARFAAALVVFLAPRAALLHAGEPRAALPPPLAEPLVMTASFGEYRANHFHAGVDLSTGEVTGRPVHCPARGEVVRVRASGIGYGRAIYVRAEDGRLLVFGHLDRFDSPIAEFVQAVQDASGDYEQDLEVPARRLPVARGQRLAWSGESGAGPPHLHFEVRRGDMNLNPLTQGLGVPDTRPPRITEVVLEPVDPAARVEGAPSPFVWRREGAGPGSVRAWGLVRVVVEAWDQVEPGGRHLAPYQVGCALDGVPQVSVAFDSVSWDEAPEVEAHYDFAAELQGRGDRLRLWRGDGWQAPLARVLPGAREPHGALRLEPDSVERTARLEVWARDHAGRADTVALLLRIPPRHASLILDSLAVVAAGGIPEAWVELRHAAADATPLLELMALEAWREVPAGRRGARRTPVAVGAPARAVRDTLADGVTVRERWRFALAAAPTVVRTRLRVAAGGDLVARVAPPAATGRLRAAAAASAAAPAATMPETAVEDLGGGLLRLTLRGVTDARGAPHGELEGAAPPSFRFGTRDGLEWAALVRAPLESATPLLAVRAAAPHGPWVGARRLSLAKLVPQGARVTDTAGRFEWRLPAGGAYAPQLASFESGDAPPPPGTRIVGPSFAIMPPWLALRRAPEISLALPAGEPERGVALMSFNGESWRFVAGAPDSAGRWSGSVRRAGTYALVRDTLPPRLSHATARRSPGLSSYAWRLRARVDDAGVGLAAGDVYFEVEGRRVPTEYDPEDREMRWRPPRAPAPGAYRYAAVARDRVGNLARAEGRFVIR